MRNSSRGMKGGDHGLDVLFGLVCVVMLVSVIFSWAPGMAGSEITICVVAFVLILLHKRRLNALIGVGTADKTPLTRLLLSAMVLTCIVVFTMGAWQDLDFIIAMIGLAFGMYLVRAT